MHSTMPTMPSRTAIRINRGCLNMSRREFSEFKPGDNLRILEDRREDWQLEGEMRVASVYNHGYQRGVGHTQTLTMTNGKSFSGWWFDPKTVCLWAKQKADVS